jgi:hypothetical protein
MHALRQSFYKDMPKKIGPVLFWIQTNDLEWDRAVPSFVQQKLDRCGVSTED